MRPQEQPQEQPPRVLRKQPHLYDEEGPRPIPGEPRRPVSPLERYPDVWGHLREDWSGPANSGPTVAAEGPTRSLTDEAPLDPTLPAHALMPEVAEHHYRASRDEEVTHAPERSTTSVNPEDLPAEMEACDTALDTLIQALRRGERSPMMQQQAAQLIERSRRVFEAIRTEAASTIAPEALEKKYGPLAQVIEEENRVLQWMYATVGVTNAHPSMETLFQTRAATDTQELQTFFRTTVDQLDTIRIDAEHLTQQPVPPAAAVERITAAVGDAGTTIAQFLATHPFADTPASSLVFGYVRALKALGDTLTVTADNQPYADRVDQLSYNHQRALKKIADFFASTSANVVLQIDEQSGVQRSEVA